MATTRVAGYDGAIRIWLLIAALVVLATVVVGGATRLTSSGLSITEWEPIIGIIPPLSVQDWQVVFDKYKTTYEFQHVNSGMTLSEFKEIFAWEWGHRVLARSIFLVVLIPFLVFLARGRLPKGLAPKVVLVLGLILLQGLVGWLMVKSGLATDVKVSHYRLALHLGLAACLYVALIAMALGQDPREPSQTAIAPAVRTSVRVLVTCLALLLLLGALVAGMRGGRIHDTWPLMEGRVWPPGMLALSPWPLNFLDNPLTVHFCHRLLAYFTILYGLFHWRMVARLTDDTALAAGARLVFVALVVQLLVGIVMVINQVPLGLGSLHQLVGFLVLGAATWHLYEIERHPAPEIEVSRASLADPPKVAPGGLAAGAASRSPHGTPVRVSPQATPPARPVTVPPAQRDAGGPGVTSVRDLLTARRPPSRDGN